ncbi:hypothetical protein ACO0LB_14985 [Undibacterium sp. SXout7W]|uniref:hypothetical protein n=1 Tax=Undibacterium sp. SXout7W TaxID=3413049 RepID=UPI003BF0287B
MRIILLLGMSLLLNACAVVYDSAQGAAKKECDKIMDWNDRTMCMQQNKKSYDQYEKDRQNLIRHGTEK